MLGYEPRPTLLTVLVANARVNEARCRLEATGKGPVVAVCADYSRLLRSLHPPTMADGTLEQARRNGVPVIEMPTGLLSRGVPLSEPPAESSCPSSASNAADGARRWIARLDAAWDGRIRSVTSLGWPAYEGRGQPTGLLDAVAGQWLGPLSPCAAEAEGNPS
jgi:hypothetical protein